MDITLSEVVHTQHECSFRPRAKLARVLWDAGQQSGMPVALWHAQWDAQAIVGCTGDSGMHPLLYQPSVTTRSSTGTILQLCPAPSMSSSRTSLRTISADSLVACASWQVPSERTLRTARSVLSLTTTQWMGVLILISCGDVGSRDTLHVERGHRGKVYAREVLLWDY